MTHKKKPFSDESWDTLSLYLTLTCQRLLMMKICRLRTRTVDGSDQPSIELHPLPEQDGIIVSINPPKEPKQTISHVPCDIVLVIDVSTSMDAVAPIPATETFKE